VQTFGLGRPPARSKGDEKRHKVVICGMRRRSRSGRACDNRKAPRSALAQSAVDPFGKIMRPFGFGSIDLDAPEQAQIVHHAARAQHQHVLAQGDQRTPNL